MCDFAVNAEHDTKEGVVRDCAVSHYPSSDVRSNAHSPSLMGDWGQRRGDVIGLYVAMQL
jgi:hypothetical protein